EHCRRHIVLTRVDGKMESLIGFDRIGAFRLKSVGADLVCQANPAAFLPQVKNDSAPLLRDRLLSSLKLFLAIAFQRSEYFACHALTVYPNGHVLCVPHITHHEG